MASQTPGIQQLLAAEKKASEKVSEARKAKTALLKAAKEEAKTEIDIFRCQTLQGFKERETVIVGSQDDVQSQMDQHQKDVIISLLKQTNRNKDEVIGRLLDLVCDVQPELHINFRCT